MAYDHLIGAGFSRWTHGQYTPGQIDFISDFDSPAILYTGSYRAGKTEICSRAVIRHALAFPGARVGVFRSKLKSLRNSTLRTVLELTHPSWVEDWNNSDLQLRLFNGSEITFLGCDFADRIGSIELSMAFIDEAHEVTTESYGMIVGRLSTPLNVDEGYLANFPQYLSYAEGSVGTRQVLLACNPKSRGHWLYRDFIDPETALPGRKVYSSNTLTNSNLPRSYLQQNLAQYARPGVGTDRLNAEIESIVSGDANTDGLHLVPLLNPFGQRNLLGLWVALEGAIFDWDADVHLVKSVPADWPDVKARYSGVDFGFHHPRAYLVELRGDRLAVVDYWHGSASDPSALVDILDKWQGVYNFDCVFMPPDQPGVIEQARNRLGASSVHKANNKVLAGIGTVQTLLNMCRLVYLDTGTESCSLSQKETEGYTWKQDRDGNFLDEPLKENDHFCIHPKSMVTTDRGRIAADLLRVGDRVLTRDSYAPVAMVAVTDPKPLYKLWSGEEYLVASGDHPVYTVERGMTPLAKLRIGDTICLLKPSDTRVSTTEDTRIAVDTVIPSISVAHTALGGLKCTSIDKFGMILTALLLKTATSTMPTETRAIMTHLIWKCCIIPTTTNYTLGRETSRFCAPGSRRTEHATGTNQMRAGSGIVPMLAESGRMAAPSRRNPQIALHVEIVSTEQALESKHSIATPTVGHHTLEPGDLVSLGEVSPCLEISVPGKEEYVANGVLVGNCDAMRYIAHSLVTERKLKLLPTPDLEPEWGVVSSSIYY